MIKSFDIKNFKDKSSFEVSKIFKKNYIDYKNSANTSNSKLFFKQNTKNIDKFLFSVADAENALNKAKVSTKIMIDTSHANSNKDPFLQPLVLKNITEQILDGNKSIVGIMVESHLKGGRQDIPENLCDLEYGKSVTDGCIDWDTTEKALLEMHEALKDVLVNR